MNTRIQELIEQSTTKEDYYPAGYNGHTDTISELNDEC